MIIDAWAQHPTLRHLQDPMFESLRRWTKNAVPQMELPVSATIAAMDQGRCRQSSDQRLVCAAQCDDLE
jgi:hypothetical protein